MAFCPTMKPVCVFAKTEEDVVKKMDATVRTYVKIHPEVVKNMRSSSIEDDLESK